MTTDTLGLRSLQRRKTSYSATNARGTTTCRASVKEKRHVQDVVMIITLKKVIHAVEHQNVLTAEESMDPETEMNAQNTER